MILKSVKLLNLDHELFEIGMIVTNHKLASQRYDVSTLNLVMYDDYFLFFSIRVIFITALWAKLSQHLFSRTNTVAQWDGSLSTSSHAQTLLHNVVALTVEAKREASIYWEVIGSEIMRSSITPCMSQRGHN